MSWRLAAPVAFVLIWSTGFIVARAVAPYASPSVFLAARFALTVLLLAALAFVTGARWPALKRWPMHLWAGALLQGGYLLGGYSAVAEGMPAASMALIGALQPGLTALIVTATGGERVGPRAWWGIVLATAGAALVLNTPDAPALAGALAAAVAALICATWGGIAQRGKPAGDAILSAMAIQNAGACAVACCAMSFLSTSAWTHAPVLWAALIWSVVALSGIAATLLVFLVRHEGAARATTLMLLAPPLAALQALIVFDERLTLIQWLGMVAALAGVWLARADANRS